MAARRAKNKTVEDAVEKVYLRPCAGVILRCGEKVLMHRRSDRAKFMPGRLSTPGGHVEENELATPKLAAVWELCEETGLMATMLHDVRLRYAKLEVNGGHVVVALDYEAWTDAEHPLSGDGEGEPCWLPCAEILDLPLTPMSRVMMRHYLNEARRDEAYFNFYVAGADLLPMGAWADIELRVTAGGPEGPAEPIRGGEMHDPEAAARRALGEMWSDAHAPESIRVCLRDGTMAVHFAYAANPEMSYIERRLASGFRRAPWPEATHA